MKLLPRNLSPFISGHVGGIVAHARLFRLRVQWSPISQQLFKGLRFR